MKYVIYPRGFAGPDTGGLEKDNEPTVQSAYSALILGKALPDTSDIQPANKEVSDLYQEYLTNDRALKSMVFRDRVLLAALNMFEAPNLRGFAKLQEYSPFFNETCMDFLNDTKRFIQTGQRRINIVSWRQMLHIQKAKASIKETDFDFLNWVEAGVIKEFDPASEKQTFISSEEMIQAWVSQKDGFVDLVETLNILFSDYF